LPDDGYRSIAEWWAERRLVAAQLPFTTITIIGY
jgi:hypothetical protein